MTCICRRRFVWTWRPLGLVTLGLFLLCHYTNWNKPTGIGSFAARAGFLIFTTMMAGLLCVPGSPGLSLGCCHTPCIVLVVWRYMFGLAHANGYID